MGRAVTTGGSALTHDLIRLRDPSVLTADAPAPPWVEEVLQRAPWVVVRRGRISRGRIPVGVRGSARHERFAALVPVSAVIDRRSPEELVSSIDAIDEQRKHRVPALGALDRVALLLEQHNHGWGPGGSVGFEITTGIPTATSASDLDLVVRQPRRLDPSAAAELWVALTEAGAPARVDVILETPAGGVLLADWAKAPHQVLLRTPGGPCLVDDPWSVDALMDVLS